LSSRNHVATGNKPVNFILETITLDVKGLGRVPFDD